MEEARSTLKGLFASYFADLSLLPSEYRTLVERIEGESGRKGRARVVADYVAGMTDRFAFTERVRIGKLVG